MPNFKRYITVAKPHLKRLLDKFETAAVGLTAGDIYLHVKKHLSHDNIPHSDEQKSHHSELSNQGNHASLYHDPADNKWKTIEH